MRYPRIPKAQWARQVTLPEKQEEIRKFYASCKNYRLTARTFKVSRSVVVRCVDPERAKARDVRARKPVLERYHSDADYRDKVIERNSKTSMERKRKFPEIRAFDRASLQERRKRNPEPHRKQMRETYARHGKKYLAQMQRKYYADLSPEKKLQTFFRHKKAVETLLEVEPLLALFHDPHDTIIKNA